MVKDLNILQEPFQVMAFEKSRSFSSDCLGRIELHRRRSTAA